MRFFASILFILILSGSSLAAQKRQKPTAPARGSSSSQAKPTTKPRIIGSSVTIMTKNGDLIKGELLDLTAYSVRIRSDRLESTHALDTLASISFGPAPIAIKRPEAPVAPVRPDFMRDVDNVMVAFQLIASDLKSGADYTDYGRLLADLRYQAERFIQKYSSSENPIEARVVAYVAGALTDYTLARTVWTLKLGRKSDGTVSESDSPAIADVLNLYADIRTAAANGNRYSADKIIGGLWKKASEKSDRARSLVAQPR